MATKQIEKTLIALAGEFAVASRLCLKGYVASLTLKNYPKVDIFCLNPNTQQQVAVQVKAKRGGHHYYVPEDVELHQVPFVFVLFDRDDKTAFFVLKARDVAEISKRERDEYIKTHPHVRADQPRMISVKSLQPYLEHWGNLWS